MQKFKKGDLVRIIKACHCEFARDCGFLVGLNSVGKIVDRHDEVEWRVTMVYEGSSHACHFKPEQLELVNSVPKVIKPYPIVAFLEKR